MHPYIPLSPDQQQTLLEDLGLSSVEDLFAHIPSEMRSNRAHRLPNPMGEMAIQRYFEELAAKNQWEKWRVFAGASCYHHFIPHAVDAMTSRSEFLTAYTPYQPEVSQGILMALFEYQTMIARLSGMDIANASLYDGATALVEAVLLAKRFSPRQNKVVVPQTIDPKYKEVLQTYSISRQFELVFLDCPLGYIEANRLSSLLDDRVVAVIVQSPNYYGLLEPVIDDIPAIRNSFRSIQWIALTTEAISLAMIPPPGNWADIFAGEGQSFGIPMGFGGPHLGLFACKERYLRKMPGRLVGKTVDRFGRPSYVITLSAREQHIRREKATSNICTNQTLMAIRAAIYLSITGEEGLLAIAEECHRRAVYLAGEIEKIEHIDIPYKGPIFNEFYIEFPTSQHRDRFYQKARERRIIAGVLEGERGMLVATTEMLTEEDLDEYLSLFDEIAD